MKLYDLIIANYDAVKQKVCECFYESVKFNGWLVFNIYIRSDGEVISDDGIDFRMASDEDHQLFRIGRVCADYGLLAFFHDEELDETNWLKVEAYFEDWKSGTCEGLSLDDVICEMLDVAEQEDSINQYCYD